MVIAKKMQPTNMVALLALGDLQLFVEAINMGYGDLPWLVSC
jgi:hypothetical protein